MADMMNTNTMDNTAVAPVVEQTAMVPMQATTVPAVPDGYISIADANKQLKKNTIASGTTGVAIGTGATLGVVFLVKKIKEGMAKRKASKIANQAPQAPAANTATPEQLANANQAPQVQATPQPAQA